MLATQTSFSYMYYFLSLMIEKTATILKVTQHQATTNKGDKIYDLDTIIDDIDDDLTGEDEEDDRDIDKEFDGDHPDDIIIRDDIYGTGKLKHIHLKLTYVYVHVLDHIG